MFSQLRPSFVSVFCSTTVLLVACATDEPVQRQSCQTAGDCPTGICIDGYCVSNVGNLGDDSDLGSVDTDPSSDSGSTSAADVGSETQGGTNDCGGDLTLEHPPGEYCGDCLNGEYVCSGLNETTCEGATGRNECEGCAFLQGHVGESCGTCPGGHWECAGLEAVECFCPDTPPDGSCEAPFSLQSNESIRVNLCGAGDASNPVEGPIDCGEWQSRGEDLIYRFSLAQPTAVSIELRDDDDSVAIDTVFYLRTECAEASSQVICADDVPCDESDIEIGCTEGMQVRHSRYMGDLEAGTYYLIIDAYYYNQSGGSFSCGWVRLDVALGD